MIRKLLLSILLVILVLLGAGVYLAGKDFVAFLERPSPAAVLVTVGKGWSARRVAADLEKRRVINSARWFSLLTRFWKEGFIQAGEYQVEKGQTPQELLTRLRQGGVVRHRLVVPEGFSVQDVAARFEKQGFSGVAELIKQPGLAGDLGLSPPSLEGWLYPDTYYYQKGETTRAIFARMVKKSQEVLDRLWQGRERGYPLSRYQALILASIIEKETGQGSERPMISGVFHNRLRLGMKLQTDPTVIYGIAHFNGNITRKHLLTPTPYNTYTIHGLPPTPIANPGAAAIHAALHPQQTKALYFVARGDGTHIFSKTYKEHDANVDRFQRKGRKKKPFKRPVPTKKP